MPAKISSSHFREFVPPAARRLVNRLAGNWTTYRGPYPDWPKAQAASKGYDDSQILLRVIAATRRVLDGQADYEQDGSAKHGLPPPSESLAAVLLAAALDEGKLSVLDIGGGLASHYLRWRRWLASLSSVRWCVVEQPHFVTAGLQLFSDLPQLSFARSIAQATVNQPNVILASSVLQYLREPMAILNELVAVDARMIIIDRTPLSAKTDSVILVQRVPRSLGRASYPLWLLPRAAVYDSLRGRYSMLAEFATQDESLRSGRIRGDYIGSIWLREP